jgi:O-antigen/teichoic acid export membrane protein
VADRGISYEDAGVNLDAARAMTEGIRDLVHGGTTGFAGTLPMPPMRDGVLVACTDGVGTKVLLARQLGPQAFGLFAIGMVAISLAGFVAGFGLSWSLMQRAKLDDEDIRFAWTWQLLAGLVALLLLQALAPTVAAAFNEPAAEPVIRWLSLSCLLQAAAAPATHLLTRALDFRALGLIQLLSYIVGYLLVGLPLAWAGLGVQALVAAWLVQASIVLLASLAVQPHPMRPLFWYARASATLGTGQAVFLTNLVNWTLANLDRMLIGRLLGTGSLGLYNVAYNLAAVPNSVLLGALQPGATASFAYQVARQPELPAATQYDEPACSGLQLDYDVSTPAAAAVTDFATDCKRCNVRGVMLLK